MSIQDIAAKLKGYRTIAFNVVAGVVGALAGQDVVNAITSLGVSTDVAIDAIVTVIVGVNIVLRYFTDTPIFKK